MAELRDYRERQRRFVGIGAYTIGRVTLARDDGADRIVQTSVTANLFPLLQVAPAQGRGFTSDEERAGFDRSIVISDRFWRETFDGAPAVLSRTLRLNGVEHTIVGVMPPGFSCGDPGTSVWKPFDLASRGPGDRENHMLSAIARMAPGTSLAEARADLQRVARLLQADLPQAYPAEARWNLALTPLRESQFGHLRTPLGALMAAAAAVLLIAGVNVAIMFLLRAAVRRRDMTIRVALALRVPTSSGNRSRRARWFPSSAWRRAGRLPSSGCN